MFGNLETPPSTTDKTGYIQYSEPAAMRTANNDLYGQLELFTVGAGILGDAYSEGAGCNISFDFFADFEWNLPGMSFFDEGYAWDNSLFDKADMLSLEFTMINNMLINAILDMGCCDIAKVYNTTMVPFFQFFADSAHGENFITMTVKFAEVITILRALVEPLECLIRNLPGNPWKDKDTDPLSWIYGYYKEALPFLNRILSGEVLDVMVNTVHNMRVKMQSCLSGETSDGTLLYDTFDVGSTQQLEAISQLAIRDGKPIKDLVLPEIKEPQKPQLSDYDGDANDPAYQSAMRSYEIAKKKYERDKRTHKILKEEVKRQSKMPSTVTTSLAVANQTKQLLKMNTNGLCACVADALGLDTTMTLPIPIRTTAEAATKLNDKSIKGVTNKAAGTVSKDRPKDEIVTIQEGDMLKKQTKKAVISAGQHQGVCKECSKGKEERADVNPYSKVPGAPGAKVINTSCNKCEKKNGPNEPCPALKANDASMRLIEDVAKESYGLRAKKDKINLEARKAWEKARNQAIRLISSQNDIHVAFTSKLDAAKAGEDISIDIETLEKIVQLNQEDINAAWAAFELYLGTWIPFNFKDDPFDQLAIATYIDDGFFEGDTRSLSSLNRNREELLNEVLVKNGLELPFPPNTPPQNIIARLTQATSVEADERTFTLYFDAGFVKRAGSRSWRDFNPLEIPYDEFSKENGAIGPDRTDIKYIAIFPNDTIGNAANIKYVRKHYNEYELSEFLYNEINDKNPKNIDEINQLIIDNYGLVLEDQLYKIDDDTLLSIIFDISRVNGYEEGKLWVRMNSVDPSLKFTYELEPNKSTFIVKKGDEVIFEPNDSVIRVLLNDSLARQVSDISNKALAARGVKYIQARQIDNQEQANARLQNETYDAIMGNLASVVPTEQQLTIPCTCENFMCVLLNTIIQQATAALNKFTKEIIDMLMKYLIPDWIKDLTLLISDMLQCFMKMVGIFKTIDEITDAAEDLLESMRDRIQYYPADACFVPENPYLEPDPFYNDNDWDCNAGGGSQDGDAGNNNDGKDSGWGEGYIPGDGTPGDGGKDRDGHRPPVIIPPDINPPGDNDDPDNPHDPRDGNGDPINNRGRGPVFRLACEYPYL